MYLLDAELKHELKREGVVPNLWVFPDKMGIYVNMVSGDALDYQKRGPEAVTNRNGGDKVQTFRGLPVFEAQSFDVEFTSEPVDLMIRERQCGEWFWKPANVPIAIYSADSDKFEKIDEPKTDEVFGAGSNESDADRADSNGTQKRQTITGSTAGYILFRPFQTYRMASAILAKGGSELGNTYHGHHDFMLSDDILRKVHVGHYTFYSKSVVKRPKNYIIVEDVFSQGYIGGEGTKYFTKGENGTFQRAMLNGELGKGGKPSIIAVACDHCPDEDVLDISGRFQSSIYDIFNDDDALVEQYQGSGSAYKDMGLAGIEPYRMQLDDPYMQRVQRYNTVCFRGMQYTAMKAGKPDVDGSMVLTQLNTGHWGTNIYAGVRKVREGENSFMRQLDLKPEGIL